MDRFDDEERRRRLARRHRLLPGTRADITKEVAGLTAAVPKPRKARSHLMGLGEFYAMYLLVWSEVLWPEACDH